MKTKAHMRAGVMEKGYYSEGDVYMRFERGAFFP